MTLDSHGARGQQPAQPPSVTPQQPATRTAAAALWMVGTVASFSLMAVAGRKASLDHDTFEIMLFRSIVGFAIVAAFGAATGRLAQARPKAPALHCARNICHFAGQNLWFYALPLIPLAEVFALEFTTPIWVALLAPLLLGEPLTPRRMLVVALGFAGILFVARPGFAVLQTGHIVAAASAIFFAGSFIATKRLAAQNSTWTILFWMTLMQIVLGLVCAGYDGDIRLPSTEALPWLALIGACGLSAHLCITSALQLAPATVVGPMDFARLPVIAAIGILLYDETLEWPMIVGAALILGGNFLNLQRKRSRAVSGEAET